MKNDESIRRAAKMLKVLGDPSRLAIMNFLKDQDANVTAICEMLGAEQSAVSHQLKVLRDYRLVKTHRDGRSIVYSPEDRHVYDFLNLALEHARESADE
ncbi:ArsR family transcriptional regulator [Atopobacter sp. AH10]|uniref:ArsR/SmtB family transcription factor n=1 Tax=Atopobacter sp. AH10 TaxID=2315861 RepID=UPI000EF21697|nr:metalloregulator ArsR/SmtB family transcription factor [Atopobacter sp. AH10]RLK63771.1 ArsR family transcriptional regulator [Atopobacter sp. AH10]